MILRKENVVLKETDESKIKELKAKGFQQANEKGKIVEEAKEKTVAESTHKKALKENKELKEQVAALDKQVQEQSEVIAKLEEESKKASK